MSNSPPLKILVNQLWKPNFERQGISEEFRPFFIAYIGVEDQGDYNNVLATLVDKAKQEELTKQNPEIFDEISFEGFHPLGLDIRCFQNHAHGPGTSLDNIENGEQILVHNSATLTINGTIDTEDYEEYKQLFIDAFEQLTKTYPVFRLNLVTMWEGCQDAIIYDSVSRDKIITVPLTHNNN